MKENKSANVRDNNEDISKKNFINTITTDDEKLDYLTDLIQKVEEDSKTKELQEKVIKKQMF